MGRQYQQALNAKIRELGADNLRAFIVAGSFSPEYEEHLVSTLRSAAVVIVDRRDTANFIIGTDAQPTPVVDCVLVSIVNHEVLIVGSIAV